MTFKRPMLAASLLPASESHTDEVILAALEKLRYPVLATLKKDGIRALRLNGSLLSRTLKPIPNKSIRERSLILPGGFDMELWNPNLTYDEVESIVMSREHVRSDEIQFHVLDWLGATYGVGKHTNYSSRMYALYDFCKDKFKSVCFGEVEICYTPEQLLRCFLRHEQEEGEGICFRLPNSPYKQGRSTLKEQYLIKLCRYVTQEVTIISSFEQENARGQLLGTLGGFVVEGKEGYFQVGTGVGLTDKRRSELWSKRDSLVGKTITVKHKPHGQKNKPRSPVIVGFRTLGY